MLVRGGAEVLGLEGPLVENSMGHFLAVLASSAAASWALWLAWSRRPLKRSNKDKGQYTVEFRQYIVLWASQAPSRSA